MSEAAPTYPYPHAERADVVEELSGHQIPDPYRPLEDPESPQTQSWLAAQAELFQEARSGWPRVDRFLAGLDRLTAFDLLSAPVWCGERAFFSRRAVGAQHTTLVVREDGRTRTLLDPHVLDPSGRTTLGRWAPSRDGALVAYEIAAGGEEEFDLYVLDVDSAENVEGPITGCRYSAVAWLPGHDAFYLVRRNEAEDRPGVHLHQVGEPATADVEVFGDGYDATAEIDVVLGADGRLLVVLASTGVSVSNEVWWADLAHTPPGRPGLRRLAGLDDGWNVVWPGLDGALYILTDDDAPRGRLVVARPVARPGDETSEELIRTLIPEDPEAVLESFAVIDGQHQSRLLLGLTAVAGASRINRYDLRSGDGLGAVPLPGAGIVSELTFREEGGSKAWFTYSDRTTPETVHCYDATTESSEPWQEVQDVGAPDVVVTEETFESSDGVEVRLLLTRPADAPPGPLPTILQGYGAFGESQVPDYYAAALAWAERGGLFAVACVRGGGESGEDWHQAGMRENKQQGIDDFTAAARYLLTAGHTPTGGLGAFGQSAGGLLVAAAMTQHPDLFAAVACTSALLDMARYELTGLGPYWTEEFGTRDNPTELGWLLGYSPYHHVRSDTPYPAVLLTALDEDTRVDPLHSRKMCAALQHATTAPIGERPILLRYETGVGHGERARDGRLAYFADVLGFFDRYLGEL